MTMPGGEGEERRWSIYVYIDIHYIAYLKGLFHKLKGRCMWLEGLLKT